MTDRTAHTDGGAPLDETPAPQTTDIRMAGYADDERDQTTIRRVWTTRFSQNRNLVIIAGVIALVAVVALVLWSRGSNAARDKQAVNEEEDEHGEAEGKEVELS